MGHILYEFFSSWKWLKLDKVESYFLSILWKYCVPLQRLRRCLSDSCSFVDDIFLLSWGSSLETWGSLSLKFHYNVHGCSFLFFSFTVLAPKGTHWTLLICRFVPFSSVQFSHSVMSNSLQPYGLQHTRLPCPLPTPGACSNFKFMSMESPFIFSRWTHLLLFWNQQSWIIWTYHPIPCKFNSMCPPSIFLAWIFQRQTFTSIHQGQLTPIFFIPFPSGT